MAKGHVSGNAGIGGNSTTSKKSPVGGKVNPETLIGKGPGQTPMAGTKEWAKLNGLPVDEDND